jgi:hypothetical protein
MIVEPPQGVRYDVGQARGQSQSEKRLGLAARIFVIIHSREAMYIGLLESE